MFIMKSNSQCASAIPSLADYKIFKRVGMKGILKLHNAKAVLTRLVNGGYIPEGNYQ